MLEQCFSKLQIHVAILKRDARMLSSILPSEAHERWRMRSGDGFYTYTLLCAMNIHEIVAGQGRPAMRWHEAQMRRGGRKSREETKERARPRSRRRTVVAVSNTHESIKILARRRVVADSHSYCSREVEKDWTPSAELPAAPTLHNLGSAAVAGAHRAPTELSRTAALLRGTATHGARYL
ncbi:hypothetical protein BC628DRAFT_571124 [Trametes gibbosa]|nr:hypothetical protein BC628DRAFT_571124 [Trametes gibbosa]